MQQGPADIAAPLQVSADQPDVRNALTSRGSRVHVLGMDNPG